MFVGNASNALRTPAGCNVQTSFSSTVASDEHCTPLGCGGASARFYRHCTPLGCGSARGVELNIFPELLKRVVRTN